MKHGGTSNFELKEWTINTDYEVGDYCYIDYKLYQSLTKHTSSTDFETDLTANNWKLIIGGSISKIEAWESGKEYTEGDKVLYKDYVYECLETHTSGANLEDDEFKWICNIETYSVTQAQYNYLVANGIIDSSNKHLYIISDAKDEKSSYEETISVSNDTWTIQHNLQTEYYKLNIHIVDYDGNVTYGDIDLDNTTQNLLVLKFDEPIRGIIYITK